MKKFILIAVVGVLAAGMIAAGSGTKAEGNTEKETLKAETVHSKGGTTCILQSRRSGKSSA